MTDSGGPRTRSAWTYTIRRTWHGFVRHRGIDSAAALTFFSALAVFPSALVVVSAFALAVGKRQAATSILDIVDMFAQESAVTTLREPISQLFSIENPGAALVIGLLLSIWSLSSYSTAFGRAVNSVYEVQEGRRIVKFRALMVMVATFLLIVFAAIVALLLLTPTVGKAIGATIGVGEPWITVWSFARWPGLLVLATMLTTVLYHFTPNVRHEKVRWIGFGSVFAIVTWSLATALFSLYVTNVGSYDRIYGWLGGGLALLVWLYISNLVLVLGAEVDAEVVRLRQLEAGIEAEETVQLPMRDTTRNLILARRRARNIAEGRAIRERHDEEPD
ncbi:YihY/virulence factor BrkB family protein [Salinibacterium sp. G-O1]|uniref:YihY/virulence factor BrkB family protein n=1 Tax=Salinibacterium sp. G-O1 TaxID=3046208 RepID=UPI0024BAA354|nr:YihY/virulence factor BrkB family protein [Salinibacterium sp. G-O1]MDJ0334762.1 YihY/virulence factor BrkB family protein [Salinibacterium sp. G-O1]